MGMEVRVVCAPKYEPDKDVVRLAGEDAAPHGGKIVVTNDVESGLKDIDIVYTDVWTSMGQEKERETRLKDLAAYQVNAELMKKTGKDTMFMHCLPAHRGEEVTAAVADSPKSVIFDEAENRLHAQKAVLALVI